ncbi:ECF RNA polymerase sigma factor SigX [Arenibacter antarcticus]|uniref:RNA polymerase sigma factor n=1 Tax=Arenibacter antarcticus TaxID=2040469 RepID=A0ABW5VII6_9FLAO|nr:sigma-70 family RNA polymerase sigma factor [Arenibacter sp. H213]MCM4166757.1 RNA polymerase subunit sigma-70 [Arenibacter sp. H213]
MDKIGNIYNAHVDDLFSYGIRLGFLKEQVMDAIHNVFHRIILNNKEEGLVNPKSYLHKSLRNELFNEFRRSKKVVLLDTNNETFPFELQVNVEDMLIEDEFKDQIKSKIENTLNELTPKQREIIYLRYTQDYDYQQIAEIMDISVPSCRNLILKALKQLRASDNQYFLFLALQHKNL